MPWAHLDLTVAKSPVLFDNERLIYVVREVGLYKGEVKASNYEQGSAYLTTHRLCYVDDKQPEEFSIHAPLSRLVSIQYKGRFMRSSAKITLNFESTSPTAAKEHNNPWICPICSFSNTLSKRYAFGVSELPVCENCGVKATEEVIESAIRSESPSANATAPIAAEESYIVCPKCTFHNSPYLRVCEVCGTTLSERSTAVNFGNVAKLSFRAGGSHEFFAHMEQTLKSKPWDLQTAVVNTSQSISESTADPSTYRFGIHSLEQASSDRQQRSNQALDAAFTDVHSIDSQASELLRLIENYTRSNPDAVKTLGLEGAVISKEMFQDEETFRQQIARQIAEFLETHDILKKEGGVISVFDVYSLYNKARGTELVSPEDVNAALVLAERLGMPIRLRKLRSGVRVVENKLFKSTQQRLAEWIGSLAPWQAAAGVSALDTSAKFGWSVPIALEELEGSEETGALCRDEQPGGVRFFENLFTSEPVKESA